MGRGSPTKIEVEHNEMGQGPAPADAEPKGSGSPTPSLKQAKSNADVLLENVNKGKLPELQVQPAEQTKAADAKSMHATRKSVHPPLTQPVKSEKPKSKPKLNDTASKASKARSKSRAVEPTPKPTKSVKSAAKSGDKSAISKLPAVSKPEKVTESAKKDVKSKSKTKTKTKSGAAAPKSKSRSKSTHRNRSRAKKSKSKGRSKPKIAPSAGAAKQKYEEANSKQESVKVFFDKSGGDANPVKQTEGAEKSKSKTKTWKGASTSTSSSYDYDYTSFQTYSRTPTEFSMYPASVETGTRTTTTTSSSGAGSTKKRDSGGQNQGPPPMRQQPMGPYNNNFDMLNYGVLPTRTAAFRAPFVPLCEAGTSGNGAAMLDAEGNIIDCDEDCMNFSFKPRPNFATEATLTVEPRKKPQWQTMMNCGFLPMIYCNVPPYCLPDDGKQSFGFSPAYAPMPGYGYNNNDNGPATSSSSGSSSGSDTESGSGSESESEDGSSSRPVKRKRSHELENRSINELPNFAH